MFVVAARYRTAEGKDDEVEHVLRIMSKLTRQEPGNRAYIAHRGADDPRKFFLYEQYVDEAAFEAHKAAPYFQQHILDTLVPMLESRERDFYETLADE